MMVGLHFYMRFRAIVNVVEKFDCSIEPAAAFAAFEGVPANYFTAD